MLCPYQTYILEKKAISYPQNPPVVGTQQCCVLNTNIFGLER